MSGENTPEKGQNKSVGSGSSGSASRARQTLLALANYNSWRRGDETLEMPDPSEIGSTIDDAVNLLREYDYLERENQTLKTGIAKCLSENAHLADGDDCTLITLKRLV